MVTSFVLLFSIIVFFGHQVEPGDLERQNDGFDYTHYEAVLARYVDDHGMVNYSGLKNDRRELDWFISALGTLTPEIYETWTQANQLSFWINAYNGLTLQAVIDHYPIQATFLKSLVYPKNSIRQIPGIWDTLTFSLLGRKLTLNQIEHEIIRKEFQDPRIHFALVCASKGCPPLRSEPFRGDRLGAQLEDQVHRFLADSEKFRIDRVERRVWLSAIFDWFEQDFRASYRGGEDFLQVSQDERPLLDFISSYLKYEDVQFLRQADIEIGYLNYDWSLNEQ